ncbi:PAS domain S-box protein [Halorientalis regularis]|nr:PAS domain S-box protein [Halorientalis regularis]
MDDVPYESIVEESNDGILVAQNGEIVYANELLQEMTGYAEATLVGAPKTMLVTDDDAALVEQYHSARTSGEDAPDQYEVTLETKSGDRVPIEFSVNQISYNGEAAVVAFCREITEQNEREATLNDLKREYESVFDHVQDALFLLDVDDDGTVRFQRFNEREEAFTGKSIEEVRGKTPTEVFGDEIGSELAANYRECIERRETLVYEEELDLTDETTIWQTKLTPVVVDGTVERIVGSGREITELKNRERELEQAKTRLQALLDEAPDAIAIHDADGNILDVNDQNVENLGYTRDELLEMNVTDFEVGLDPETAQETWAAMDIGETLKLEGTHQRKDGSTFPTEVWVSKIEVLGEPQYLALGRDITERKERERQIQELKDRLELAVEGAELGVWDWNVKTDEVEFNDQWAEMLGYDPANIGDHLDAWEKRVHPDDISEVEATLESHLAGETEYYDSEHRMKTVDGNWKWIRDIGEVVERDDNGDPVRAVGIHLDIDERKRREQELKESREQITEQNNALESFTEIVTDAERTVDQQITDLLDLGASYLDLDIGILSEIDGSEYTVRNVVAAGDAVEPGDTFDLTDTYCSLVYDADGPVVFHSADAGSVKDHPAYQNRGMEAYVGVPVFVDDRRYGTLNFSRPESRETPITDAEESFVRIMAQWIGMELTRQQREQELERTSQFLQDSQEVASIGGWEVGLQSETLRWSEQVHRIHGLPLDANPTPEDAIEFYHPEDRDTIREAFNRLTTEGEPYDLELRIIRADNDEVRWVRTRGEPRYADDEIAAVHGTFQDITERKRRERKLEQFREAVEQTGHAVYITDTNGSVEYINSAFEEITGYSEDEVIGDTPRLLKSGEHEDAFYEELWETVGGGNHWEREIVDKRADGEEIVLYQTISPITDSDGEPQKLVAVAQDITERKEYEEALEATQEKLRKIIDLVPDLIFVKNREGEYLLANETTAKFYGMEPEDVEGRHETEVIPSVEDSEEFRQDDIEVIESGEAKFVPEEELTTADGETRILQTTKIPYQVPESGEDAVLGYARDVTDLTEYQHKLESQRDNLEILNQVVRHDIRNDLQLVLAYAEMLATCVDPEGDEYVEQVLDATRDAIDITTTARDVTRVMLQSDVDLTPVRLRPALESEVDNVRSNYEEGLVRIDGTIPDIEVLGDGMLKSVFRNLLKNAIQHNDKEVPEVSVSATQEDDIVAVRIADNGPGISDERKEKIFQQGEMGLDSEGTGLGLYLVETLVDRYGGSVYAEDNDPMGAVFVVELLRST